MKITKKQLKSIIKEELENITEMFGRDIEGGMPNHGPRFDMRAFADEVGLAVNELGGAEVLRIVQGVIDSVEV